MSVFDGLGNLRQDRMPRRRDRVRPMANVWEPEYGEDLFTNRPPNAEQAGVLDTITATMLDSYRMLLTLPPSRFRSLAITKLEEVSMWAKKATVFTVGIQGHPNASLSAGDPDAEPRSAAEVEPGQVHTGDRPDEPLDPARS